MKNFKKSYTTLTFHILALTTSLLSFQLAGCTKHFPLGNIHDADEALPGSVLITARIEITDLPTDATKTNVDAKFTIKSLDSKVFGVFHRLAPSNKKFFYWYLPPGRYEIDKYYFFQKKGYPVVRTSYDSKAINLNFSVPENAHNIYIGSVVMSLKSYDHFIRNLKILDESKEAEMAYNEKFQTSNIKFHKNLMTWTPPR